ncbi:MAG TPA: hypothetical protein VJ440_03670 [Candidatus Brocadiaceae bacterium]|nr:hypothetical protein [Candidatus Brocadiaceae bacterium]
MIPAKTLIILSLLLLCVSSIVFAGEVPFTLEDRDRLTRIEARLDSLEHGLGKRFDQVDIRFAELREDMNKRFEQVDKRFDQMFNFVWILATIFTAITVATIGFAVWDRRTMVRPFESKVKQIEARIEGVDKDTVNTIVRVLKEFAIMDVKMGDILKKFHL